MPTPPVNERLDHQPLDRRHAPAVLDRGGDDLAHLGERPSALLGREARVVHQPERDREHHDQHDPAQDERHAEVGLLRDEPSRDRAREHRRSPDDLAAPEHRLQLAREAGRGERVDEPGLDRAGEEREAETEQDRTRPPTARTAPRSARAARRATSSPPASTCRAGTRRGARRCRRRPRSAPRTAPSPP